MLFNENKHENKVVVVIDDDGDICDVWFPKTVAVIIKNKFGSITDQHRHQDNCEATVVLQEGERDVVLENLQNIPVQFIDEIVDDDEDDDDDPDEGGYWDDEDDDDEEDWEEEECEDEDDEDEDEDEDDEDEEEDDCDDEEDEEDDEEWEDDDDDE